MKRSAFVLIALIAFVVSIATTPAIARAGPEVGNDLLKMSAPITEIGAFTTNTPATTAVIATPAPAGILYFCDDSATTDMTDDGTADSNETTAPTDECSIHDGTEVDGTSSLTLKLPS